MHRKRNSGFTLVELVVVILIMAIFLGMIAICGVGGYLAYDHLTSEDDQTEVKQVDTEQVEENAD